MPRYLSLRAVIPLLPHGTCSLLAHWPELLPELFTSLRIPNYISYASELLADLANSLRAQLAPAGLATNSVAAAHLATPAGGGEAASEVPPEVRARWMELMVRPLVSALVSAQATHSEHLLAATLPAVLGAQPACLRWVLQIASDRINAREGSREEVGATSRLVTNGGGEGAGEGGGAQTYVRLVISLLKAARALGLLSAEELGAADAQFGTVVWPVRGSLLASTLLGSDEQVALDSLELLCVALKHTEPASELELELLRLFVPLRLKGSSANSRKHTVDELRKWLVRGGRST